MIVACNASRAKPVPARAHRPTIAPKKGQDMPGHSDSSRFNPPALILTENPTGTGNEAISQHYWARINCSCRNVSVHPAFSPESSVTPSGSGLEEEAFEIPSPRAPNPRQRRRVMRAWVGLITLRSSVLPPPIRTSLAELTTAKRGRDDEPMKTKCGQAYDRRCVYHSR
jgi:hypothetical protein